MLFIQYIVLILLALIIIFIYKKRKDLSTIEYLIWIFASLIIGIVAVFPITISNTISNITGIARGIDALFVVGFILTYSLMLKLYIKVYDLENQLTEMNKEVSIRLKNIEDSVVEEDEKD